MSLIRCSTLFLAFAYCGLAAHVWEKQEITLTAARSYNNPYTDVTVWVHLTGPGFDKRVYGFWDGGQTFRVRVVPIAPGEWKWTSGSSPEDTGLSGKSGSFAAVGWTEQEKQANSLRHGFIRATANQHALEHADGTPFFAIGDTWYAAGTNRFKWYDDDTERPIGPSAGFKDYVRFRKDQGYNWVNIIAAFPNWDTDGLPWNLKMSDGTTIRSAWVEFGSNNSAKNMRNEGGRPFLFPGKVPGFENVFPDIDRINPEYFKYIDRKIDYLNEHGFVPFIEVSRRDASMPWSKYYPWPGSYSRYIQYVWSRYQANNVVLSPVHLDIISESIGPADYIRAIDMVKDQYGLPPFGTLLSANANPSTLENWGDNSWVTLQQTGNMREHNNYWYLTEIYQAVPHRPALNGEPYYAGYKDARAFGPSGYKYGAEGGTEKDDQFVRSAMYGNFLSGGYGGHVYGAEGIWGADIEREAPTKMWDAFQWRSGAEMQHLRTFALSIGKRYQELEPDADLVSPNKTAVLRGYEGWAYCSRTPDRHVFLAYFEKGCPRSQVRGALLNAKYRAEWFDPRTGSWSPAGTLTSSNIGIIAVPDFPSDNDWALRLTHESAGDLPRMDLHAHIEGESPGDKGLSPAEATAISRTLGVRLGILGEGGCAGEIHDDRTLGAFLDSLVDQPVWRGLQVYGFDWQRCLSKSNLDRLDYIAADALVFPQPGGKTVWLWLPGVQFPDAQEFMDRYVDFNVRVLSQPIQVWANPTYLPASLQSRYDELWTPERMDKVIAAAVKNGVAIEINAHFEIPSVTFIRRAKVAGARFSIGSNRHAVGIGEIDFCLRRARECGLTAKDIYVPPRRLDK
jgi:hypothetical protein